MSTVDHILAECGRLRTAWGWLVDSTIPGRTRRNQRVVSDTAKVARDKRAAAERNDRAKLLGSGKLLVNTHAPANINALDAKEKIASEVDIAAWVMASDMRQRGYNDPNQGPYRPDGRSTDHRFKTGIDWISKNAPRLQDGDRDTINSVHGTLVASTSLATAVSGSGEERRPLAAECPACGRRSLAWDTSSINYQEWHVMCTSLKCRCQGRDCGCNQPDREPGMTHVWLEAQWDRLGEQLARREAR